MIEHTLTIIRERGQVRRRQQPRLARTYVQEGDRLWAADYVTGSFEVRQLRSVYKLSFLDITRVNRFRLDGEGGEPRRDDVTDDASNESLAIARKAEREKSTVRLRVYLTKKKAKARMGDLEETAFLLRLDAGTEGCICYGNSFGDFDQVWLKCPPCAVDGVVPRNSSETMCS